MTRALARCLARVLLAGVALAACEVRAEVPAEPTRWVTDSEGFLSSSTREELDGRLETYQRQSGHQVLLWIGPTTGDVPLEDFTVRAFAAWKVGREGLDDGLVLFVFADQRNVRVEVGYGLEGVLPDAIASRIIRETIVPRVAAGLSKWGQRQPRAFAMIEPVETIASPVPAKDAVTIRLGGAGSMVPGCGRVRPRAHTGDPSLNQPSRRRERRCREWDERPQSCWPALSY